MPIKRSGKKSGKKTTPNAKAAILPPSVDQSIDAALAATVAEVQKIYNAIPHLGKLRDEVLFGDVWKRAELSPDSRSLVTCAILAALGRQDELRIHVRRAVSNGVTPDELRGLAVHVAFYAGWPAGLSVGRAALPYLL